MQNSLVRAVLARFTLATMVASTGWLGTAPISPVSAAAPALCNGLTVTITGTTGSNTLNGTPGDDVIHGWNGNDIINGNGGNDTICGGDGQDIITTLGGNDWIDGEKHNDTINAGDGTNTVKGDAGDDELTSGTGNDTLEGGNGDDTIEAGAGHNTVHAGRGNDDVTTLGGNDWIDGNDDADTIDAGDGMNTVQGGDGKDSITTGAGDDTIDGGDDNDTINAGEGANDVLGGDGRDSITTGAGDDSIDGGDDNDIINAGNGVNTVQGGDGQDAITTGTGNDSIDGGDDSDVCVPGSGVNIVINCESGGSSSSSSALSSAASSAVSSATSSAASSAVSSAASSAVSSAVSSAASSAVSSTASSAMSSSSAMVCGWDDCTGPAPGTPYMCTNGQMGGPVCTLQQNGQCGWEINTCEEAQMCEPEEATLAAYWKMDEEESDDDVEDETSPDNDGERENGAGLTTSAAPVDFLNMHAGTFDGTDDYVIVQDTAGLPEGNDPRTIALWVNMDTVGHQATLVSMGNGNTSDQRFILQAGNEPAIGPTYVFTDGINGANNITISGPEVPSIGGWHHVAFSYDGAGNWAYYLDGALTKSGVFPVAIDTVVNALEIGARHDSATGYFDGRLDDVRIYSSALTAAQVANLAAGSCESTAGGSSSSSVSSAASSAVSSAVSSSSSSTGITACVPSGLLAHWNGDENTGTTATDSTGNGHTGTLQNGTTWVAPGASQVTPNVSAFGFDGTDDVVRAAGSDFAFGTQEFTVTAFAKVAPGNGDRSVLGHYGSTGAGHRGWGLYFYNTGRVNFFGYGSMGVNDASVPATVLNDQWHHVAGVYRRSGNSLSIDTYVDGTLIGTNTVTVGDISLSTDMLLGKYQLQPNMLGSLDDVRVYGRALSAGEVQSVSSNCASGSSSSASSAGSSSSVSSSSSSTGGSSSSSSSVGNETPTIQGLFGDGAVSDGNGGYRGNRTNEYAAKLQKLGMRFGLGGTTPPAGFGGTQRVPLGDSEIEYICSMQRTLPATATLTLYREVAGMMADLMGRDAAFLTEKLRDADLCDRISAGLLPAKALSGRQDVVVQTDAKGFPISKNPSWNACGKAFYGNYTLTKQDIQGNPDIDKFGTPRDCAYYNEKDVWYFPDESVYFTFDADTGTALFPAGYSLIPAEVAKR